MTQDDPILGKRFSKRQIDAMVDWVKENRYLLYDRNRGTTNEMAFTLIAEALKILPVFGTKWHLMNHVSVEKRWKSLVDKYKYKYKYKGKQGGDGTHDGGTLPERDAKQFPYQASWTAFLIER
ncbi:hypothetical protein EC968_007779 [Mortierella alpina]|nr:hypothetical protein EC968_007779 [Mortierella alpina]